MVEYNDGCLRVQRLNTSEIADIKSILRFWFMYVIMLIGVDVFSLFLNNLQRRAGDLPAYPFLSAGQLVLCVAFLALLNLVNLGPLIVGLQSPQFFEFDKERNAFVVGGKWAGSLHLINIRLQDSIGPSQRAFRILVTAIGREYVIARTQRMTIPMFSINNYSIDIRGEGRKPKYRYNRWADYAGDKTGFEANWPEYREIFALYYKLKEYVETKKG